MGERLARTDSALCYTAVLDTGDSQSNQRWRPGKTTLINKGSVILCKHETLRSVTIYLQIIIDTTVAESIT